MATHRLGLIMHGITGRMGYNQHLVRSILAIRAQGGVALPNGDRVMPDPDPGRAQRRKARRDRRAATASPARRPTSHPRSPIPTTPCSSTPVRRRCGPAFSPRRSRPASMSIAKSRSPSRSRTPWPSCGSPRRAASRAASCRTSSIFPGCASSRMLRDAGFFGRILSVRGEFGYWVFEGDWQPAQRPSWNYRKADGGGIILDMLCHWRYVLDNLFGRGEGGELPRRQPYSRARRRGRPPLPGRCGRCRLRHLRARGRRRRPHQFVLVRAGAPRRPRHLPGRRHARLGGGRADPLLHPASGQHAAAGVEPRPAAGDRPSTTSGTRFPTIRSTTTASRRSGRSSSATSSPARRGAST